MIPSQKQLSKGLIFQYLFTTKYSHPILATESQPWNAFASPIAVCIDFVIWMMLFLGQAWSMTWAMTVLTCQLLLLLKLIYLFVGK